MGNITEVCCSNVTARLLIIGPDSDGKLKLYEKMTHMPVNNRNEMHLETKTKYLNTRMMLCCLNNTESIQSVEKTQMDNVDGTIYVINYDDKESANDFESVYKKFGSSGHKVLILLNKSVKISEEQMIRFNEFQRKNKKINYRNVNIDLWEDVDDGLSWLIKSLGSSDN